MKSDKLLNYLDNVMGEQENEHTLLKEIQENRLAFELTNGRGDVTDKHQKRVLTGYYKIQNFINRGIALTQTTI